MIRGRRYAYRFVLADSDERTYWKKTFVDEYLPALSLDNQSLMNYVRSQTDWSKDDAGVPVDLGAALEFFRGLNNLFAYFIARGRRAPRCSWVWTRWRRDSRSRRTALRRSNAIECCTSRTV